MAGEGLARRAAPLRRPQGRRLQGASPPQSRRQFGRIDILVNNAGVAGGAPVEELTEEVWDANLDINLKGTFLMCQAVIPTMKRQRSGRILNAASFAAIIPSSAAPPMRRARPASIASPACWPANSAPWNVTVNCYSPGMIPTEMNRFAERRPSGKEPLLDTLTLRRWGDPRTSPTSSASSPPTSRATSPAP